MKTARIETIMNDLNPSRKTAVRSRAGWSSVLLILSALLALPALVQAQVNYAVSGNTAYVTNSPNAVSNVVISNIYDGYPVTSIGAGAFAGCHRLASVTIPNSVTSIGAGAFGDCTSLTSITVDAANPAYSSMNGVLFDKAQATLLQFPGGLGGSYTIPNSVTSIGVQAFFDCTGLTNITVDAANPAYSSTNGVLFDKAQATLLQFPGGLGGSYTIPNGVTSIGTNAFADCYGLTNVIIPNSVTSIGNDAFDNCQSLTSVAIPNSVTSIMPYAFAYCISLTSVTIPNSVTSIGNDAFDACERLTSVTIPNSVTSIGDGAFAVCSSLTSVTIPASVTNIGYLAFEYCYNLTSAYFLGNAPPDNGYAFCSDPATVYYLAGTTGWGSTFGGVPAVLWNPQATAMRVTAGQFGFNLTGPATAVIVVEAATNLANPVWMPVSTNTLTGGTSHFSDPQWTNYPSRFYRVRSSQ